MSKMFEIEGQVIIPHVFTKLINRPEVWVYWDGIDKIGYFKQEEYEIPARTAYRYVPVDDDPFEMRANQQQPPQAWVEAKKEIDDGWPDR